MSFQIRSSPKLRERKPQEPPETSHRFVVRDTAESERSPRRVGATGILKGAITAIVLLVVALALFSAMQGPDPHYLAARKLVHDYEFGKPVAVRNYEYRIYGDAMDELALVNPRSNSAEAAESLRTEIERGIADFRRRQAKIQQKLDLARSKKQRRETEERHARLAARALPEVDYPECDYEEDR